MYVNSIGGLRVRNSPSIDGDKIALLDNLTEVLVIKEEKNNIDIDGINSKWTFIEFENIQGWVFGGYLSRSKPIPRMMDSTIETIANYIAKDINLFNYELKNSDRTNLKDFLAS